MDFSFPSNTTSRVFRAMTLAALLTLLLAGQVGAQQSGATASLAPSVPAEAVEQEAPDVRLFNEYIAINVNATDENTGRFSIETTGGDPDRTSDDRSPLIYKVPGQSPWTSYTTVRIDGIDYVFGGKPTERAGRAGLFGEMIAPPRIVEGNRIETVFQIGPIQATQNITIIRSSTTGLLDTARIEYQLTNTGSQAHSVGLRLMLDTMLGANDGAPFRVEELAIVSDTGFFGDRIPEFWQAFDSLSDPRVTAQGSMRGRDVTPPDRVYFTNWGAVADGLWDFDFQPGRDFTRLGEFELDSATALYWDPAPLSPNETRHYVTHYGLGGISISPGQLSIGVTSPATVTADPQGEVTFTIVAYIQNTGEGEARGVVARLSLPRGLKPAAGEALSVPLENLPAGRTGQVSWRVALDGAVGGELTYTVGVEAINAEPNEVSRSVRIVSPAKLTIDILNKNGRLRVENDAWTPLPYPVDVRVRNDGGADADDVTVWWESPLLELAPGDRAQKPLGPMAAGEEVTLRWHVRPLTVTSAQPYPFVGNLAYSVKGGISGLSEEFRAEGYVDVPPLESEVQVETVSFSSDGVIRAGDYFLVRVKTQNVRTFHGARVALEYDADAIELVGGHWGVDRGRLFVDATGALFPWKAAEATIDPVTGVGRVVFAGDRGGADSLFWVSDTIATLRFKAKKVGNHGLALVQADIFDRNNQGVRAETVHGRVAVME